MATGLTICAGHDRRRRQGVRHNSRISILRIKSQRQIFQALSRKKLPRITATYRFELRVGYHVFQVGILGPNSEGNIEYSHEGHPDVPLRLMEVFDAFTFAGIRNIANGNTHSKQNHRGGNSVLAATIGYSTACARVGQYTRAVTATTIDKPADRPEVMATGTITSLRFINHLHSYRCLPTSDSHVRESVFV